MPLQFGQLVFQLLAPGAAVAGPDLGRPQGSARRGQLVEQVERLFGQLPQALVGAIRNPVAGVRHVERATTLPLDAAPLLPTSQRTRHALPDRREFAALEANDILFIDSTHVAKINSDVNAAFFDILPQLAPGVCVHFHDIFYPFEYPRAWVYEGRNWNEAYLLRAFLLFNTAFAVRWFTTFLTMFHRERFAADMPAVLLNPGGSIWLQRR